MSIKIVSVRDGFKDEDGVWREKWCVVTVSDHFAQALIARERTVFSTASLKDQIAKGLPQITVRNFCRALGLPLEGDMAAWRHRAIAAIEGHEAAEDARIAKLAEAPAPAAEDDEKKDHAADHVGAEGSSTPPETDHAALGDGDDPDDAPADAPAEDAAAPAEKPARKPRKAK